MSATETEEVGTLGTETGEGVMPDAEQDVSVEESPETESAVEQSGGDDHDAGGSDDSPPAEVSDELRKRGRDLFDDDELRALGTPEAVDSARRKLLASMVRHEHPEPEAKTETPVEKPEESPDASEKKEPFALKLDREKFDEDQAAEIERALQGIVEHFTKEVAPTAGKVNEITQAMESQRVAYARAYESELVKSVERIQKSMGATYADLFGKLPIREIVKRPDSAEFKRVQRWVRAMEEADARTSMGGPSTWDADFGVDMLYGSRDPELVQIARRAQRKSINGAISNMAKGATRAPASRREEPPKTMKQLREEAINEAKALRAKARQ